MKVSGFLGLGMGDCDQPQSDPGWIFLDDANVPYLNMMVVSSSCSFAQNHQTIWIHLYCMKIISQ